MPVRKPNIVTIVRERKVKGHQECLKIFVEEGLKGNNREGE
jgi:hypothetical protein